MALTTEELAISVTVKSEGAKKALDEINKSLTDIDKVSIGAANSTEKLDGAFEKTTFGVIGLNQALELAKKAMNLIGGEISKLIDGAIEQEQAEQKVINALRLRGVTSRAVLKDIQNFSAGLQANSVYGDEVTMTLVSQALAMGKSLEQSKAMVQASAELASVTGQDLDSAFRMVNQTFSGTTMGLKRLGIDLSQFTQEELEAGAAVDHLNKLLGGSAKLMSETLGGAIEQAKNAWGDLYETTGTFLVQVVKLDKIFIGITAAIGTTITAVTNFSNAINQMNLEDFIVILTAVGAAITTVFYKQMLTAVTGIYTWVTANIALTGSLWAVVAPIGLIALKIVAVLAVLSAVYIAFKNWELIVNLVKRAMYELAIQVNKVIAMVGTLTKFLGKFSSTAQKFGNRMETGATKTVQDLRGEVDKLKKEAPKFDAGTFGRAFKFISGESGKAKDSVEDAKKAMEDYKKIATSTGGGAGAAGATIKKQIDDANKSFEQLQSSLNNVGKDNIDQAIDSYNARKLEINAYEELNKKLGTYGKVKKEIEDAKNKSADKFAEDTLKILDEQLAKMESANFDSVASELDKISKSWTEQSDLMDGIEKQLTVLDKKFMDDSALNARLNGMKKIDDMQNRLDNISLSLDASVVKELDKGLAGMATRLNEIAKINQDEYTLKLASIAAKEKEISFIEKEIAKHSRNKSFAKEALDAAKEQLKIEREMASLSRDQFQKGSMGEYEQVLDKGAAAIDGAAATMGSAFTAAGGQMIGAVGGIVGLIISIIDKIADIPSMFTKLFDNLTNMFPKLLANLQESYKAAFNMAKNFGRNLFENLGQIIFDALDQGIDMLLDGLIEGADQLARGLEKFIGKLPEIVAKFVELLITILPKLTGILLNFIINGLPRIFKAILKAIPEIIAAVIVGLIEGIKEIGRMLVGIFTGGFASGITDPINKVITKVSGATEEMFAVIEMGARSKARSSYADAQKELSSMWDRIKGWLKKLFWDIPLWLTQLSMQITTIITGWIMGALVWVFEKSNELAMWIWQGFVTALTWLLEPFVKWLLEGVTWLFANTIVKVGEWIFGGINYVFTKLVDLIGRLITGAFTFVFSTLIPAIGNFFVSGFKYIFTTLIPAIGEFFKSGFKAVWSLTKDIGDFVVGAFKFAFKELPTNIANFLKGGFTAVFKDLPSAFGNMIYDAFVFVKDKLSKFISGLFSFSNITGGGGGSGGSGGSGGGVINTIASAGGKINPISYIPPTDSKLDPRNWFYDGGLVRHLNDGGILHAAMGAMTQGDSKLNDRIPAMLSAGELVVPRTGVDNVLDLIRGKKLMPNVAGSGGDTTINMSINITTTEPIDDKYFRNSIMPKVREELRRASLDGRRVLAPSGVR